MHVAGEENECWKREHSHKSILCQVQTIENQLSQSTCFDFLNHNSTNCWSIKITKSKIWKSQNVPLIIFFNHMPCNKIMIILLNTEWYIYTPHKGGHRSVSISSVKKPPKQTQTDQGKILTKTELNQRKTEFNRISSVWSVIRLTDFIF